MVQQMADPNYQGFMLPTVINPPDSLCFMIKVPNDPGHIAAFFGALYDLTLWLSWQRDPAKQGIQAAQVWKEIWVNLAAQSCNPPTVGVGTDGGEDFMIRQNPTNPCILESSVDGVTWCQWADLSKCIPSSNQPGAGTAQPAPGGCSTFQGQFNASEQFLVPVPVSTGDTLNLTNVTGAGNDGASGTWNCPDGTVFFAGACLVGTGATVGTDPLPSVKHMRLIWKIGGSYYDAMAGVFTVPAGVSNVQPVLLVNDSPASDDNGSYQFTLQVCNNSVATWTHTLNFGTSPGGFVIFSTEHGVYTPGSGWQPSCVDGANMLLRARFTAPADFTVVSISVIYSQNVVGTNGAEVELRNVGLGILASANDNATNGTVVTNRTYAHTFNQSGVRNIDIDMDQPGCTSTGLYSSLTIVGSGPDPF